MNRSTASDDAASRVARRCRVRNTFVGSLATRPSGVTLPMASPARYATNACRKGMRTSGAMQRRQHSARRTKRKPEMARIGRSPQPTRRMPAATSSHPTLRMAYANSAMPPSAAAAARTWRRTRRGMRGLTGALRFDLPEGLFDEALVVFLRHRALQDLRRDRHREVGRLGADLLQRARRLQLDLPLGV